MLQHPLPGPSSFQRVVVELRLVEKGSAESYERCLELEYECLINSVASHVLPGSFSDSEVYWAGPL